MKGPELVVAGNLLVDDIVLHDGRTLMGEPGGGALYVSLAASLWSVRVGLVSVLGNDYPPHAIEALRAHAVNLEGVRPLDGPSLRTWLLYEPRGRQIVRQLEAQSHAAVSPVITDVPRHFREARLVHVCPMPFEYQSALVAALRDMRGAAGDAPALSLDPHESVREDNLAMWRSVLERSNFAAGCAVTAVTVAADASDLIHEASRIFRDWRGKLADLFAEGGVARERAAAVAATLISASEGAVILSRAERSFEPFDLVAAEEIQRVRWRWRPGSAPDLPHFVPAIWILMKSRQYCIRQAQRVFPKA